MMRTAVLCASLSILAACATPSASLPGPVEAPAAKRPDPRICADVQRPAGPPKAATIVQPVPGTAEAAATQAFLNWVAGLWAVAIANADRAELARGACK